jgi:hypothetical protein
VVVKAGRMAWFQGTLMWKRSEALVWRRTWTMRWRARGGGGRGGDGGGADTDRCVARK